MPVATANQTIGPYWHLIDDPAWADLTRFGADGEKIVLTGTVTDGAGTLVTDAAIEIWQTSPEASDTFPAFGRCRTDTTGSFRFVTLKPGPVAGLGNAQQAPHVAVSIFARGLLQALTTRLYFQDEPLNETDPVLSLIEDPARRRTLIARKVSSDTWHLDIRLQGGNETVFMEDLMTPIAPLPKSIATVSLSGTLGEKMEAAAAIGFDGVEIFENDLLTFEGSPTDVRYLAESLGLTITCFQPFRDFESMPEPQRARNMDRAERKFDVMQQLGAELLLVCSNVSPASIDDDARATADLHEMADRAQKRGLRVGFEALAWGRNVRKWRHAWNIVQAANHPALGLIVDSFHTLALDDDLSGLNEVPADKIFLAQLADAPKLTMDVLSWSRHFRNFPGQGQLPVANFVRDLVGANYRGPLSLEIFNDEFRSAPARLMARDGLRSLLLAEAEAGATALPPVPIFDGIEFLEFAVDEASGRRLGETLRGLGFHYAGRHRSKSVDLFRQGRINLILNSEQDSAAAEHFQFHGPSVCAMAFRVDHAAQAVARAEALLCPPWQEQIGPGERQIPAVRAPDGTLLYLVESSQDGSTIYDVDFDLFTESSAESLLNSVDHVAQALPMGRMDNFVLFYRALFGFTPDQLWEIPDTMGLIQSRTMASVGRTIRLPLNISESRETTTGRFLTTSSGAGVQHIAMATTDMRKAMEQLAARGARFLPIPGNYYEDIEARWGLEPDRVDMLRTKNVLYDRDDAGEFLHAYTDPFDDRFFFEIVQRIGGYQQYGAANASVRMAAQAKRRNAAPRSELLG